MADLRLAAEEDVAGILAISNRSAATFDANFATEPEPLEHWLTSFRETHERFPWIVAEAERRVVGFAKAGPYRTRGAYLWTAETSIYLDPEAQGRGLGRRLYEVLLGCLRAQGFATVLAGVRGGHVASEQLHARFGFQRCGMLHRVGFKGGRWLDVGFWELHLTRSDDRPAPPKPVAEVWQTLQR